MKNEAIDQLKYITKLEHLVVQSVKSQTKFRNKIKNKLKSLCLLLVDKGIKPDEIVKCISSNLECKNKTEDYDFSEDSEDEVEKLEKEVYDEKRNGDIKNHNEDTESDTDLSNIAKKFETDSVFVSSHVDTLKRLKNFFEKNRRKLKEDKEYQSVNKIHFSNQANAPHQGNITNFYSDSITNIQYQNDTTLLNKKRNKN